MKFNNARFNQDGTCIVVSNDRGFKILNSNPMVVTCDRDLRHKNVGTIGMAEMLYRSNLLALVGNSEYYDIRKSPSPISNKFIRPWKQNILTMWDDKKGSEVAQLVFNDSILNVKMLYDLVVVVLDNKVYTYQMGEVILLDVTNTEYNPSGICSATTSDNLNFVGFPGKMRGTVVVQIYYKAEELPGSLEILSSFDDTLSQEGGAIDVFNFKEVLESGETVGKYVKVTMKMHVHTSEITSVDFSPNGRLMVTSSAEGHFIKLFDTLSGELIQVFRKSHNFGKVIKCSIDKNMKWLGVITDKPKLYLYQIDQEAVSECEMDKVNRTIDFKNSCIFDINNEDSSVGKYFRFYKFLIVKKGPCLELKIVVRMIRNTVLFMNSKDSFATFTPRNKERILDFSIMMDKETIVILTQDGKATKLFFNPDKTSKLKTLFYHNL